MRNIWFIAAADVRQQIRQVSTIVWVFVMPPIFFYFIGTVTGGFSGSLDGSQVDDLVVVAEAPGWLRSQIDLRLVENQFSPRWVAASTPEGQDDAIRVLEVPESFTARLGEGDGIVLTYHTRASALTREYEVVRLQRALYTALADVVVADASSEGDLTPDALASVTSASRAVTLDVRPAGPRREIPVGFSQSIPGIMVMFTLLVLLTSGASTLAVERRQGLLRRLASAPISRAEIVTGKWLGRMVLASIQILVAVTVGTLVFDMDWGPDLGMVLLVVVLWGGFCASAGLLLGSIAATEGQASGLGVLLANVLAALGGCWWPIEVTPAWMQAIQKLLPTGWTMDALHRLVSFEAGAAAAVPHALALAAGALVVGALAVRQFRFQ